MELTSSILLCFLLSVGTTCGKDHSASSKSVQQQRSSFFILHRMSDKVVGPYQGEHNPPDSTSLIVHSQPVREYDRWEFTPSKGHGHFGYIQHATHSKKYVSTSGELDDPDNSTGLVISPDKSGSVSALFAYDSFHEHWVHFAGKYMTPTGQKLEPKDNDQVELHTTKLGSVVSKFATINKDGNKTSPYPDPDLSGDWEIIKVFIKPESTFTDTFQYKVGKSLAKSATEQNAWYVSALAAKEMFQARAELSDFMERSGESTWMAAYTHTETITLQPDLTVAVWQYVFKMDQYDEQYEFRSNIVIHSHSMVKKPDLSRKKSEATSHEEL